MTPPGTQQWHLLQVMAVTPLARAGVRIQFGECNRPGHMGQTRARVEIQMTYEGKRRACLRKVCTAVLGVQAVGQNNMTAHGVGFGSNNQPGG